MFTLYIDGYSMKSALGLHSRFGDGDGSFWDKYMIANERTRNRGQGYNEKSVPLQK